MKKITLKNKVKNINSKFVAAIGNVVGILLGMVIGYLALTELANVVEIHTAWYHDILAFTGIFDDVTTAIIAWAVILVLSFSVIGYRAKKLNDLFKAPKSKGEDQVIELPSS